MILNVPHWSDISAQLMHGFPWCLITDHHRGILMGNITVAARISNQAIRSLATGNWDNKKKQELILSTGCGWDQKNCQHQCCITLDYWLFKSNMVLACTCSMISWNKINRTVLTFHHTLAYLKEAFNLIPSDVVHWFKTYVTFHAKTYTNGFPFPNGFLFPDRS